MILLAGKKNKSKKGTWPRAIFSFLSPILAILIIRWVFIEPYVIPSGSMIPQLLVNDHILVNKFSYGLRWPFSDYWIFQWSRPQRGDVIVFRYPRNPDIFYVKRLIGMPGDRIVIMGHKVYINGDPLYLEKEQDPGSTEFSHVEYREKNGMNVYKVRWRNSNSSIGVEEEKEFLIPDGEYFFLGDNRDDSSDSRVWGNVSEKLLIGKVGIIWLSCHEMLASNRFICDPSQIRWDRLLSQPKL